MDKIPFSVYDFFAYLSSGAVLVATADYIWGLKLLSPPRRWRGARVALVIVTYVTGQAIAQFSSLFFEQIAVHRVLKRPSSLLMGATPRLRVFR